MTPYNTQNSQFSVPVKNKLGPLVAKILNKPLGTSGYGQGPIVPSFKPIWPHILPKTANLVFQLLNKLGLLVAKILNNPLGTSSYGQGPILPSLITIWPHIIPKTAHLVFRLLNKLGPLVVRLKNKTRGPLRLLVMTNPAKFHLKIPKLKANSWGTTGTAPIPP